MYCFWLPKELFHAQLYFLVKLFNKFPGDQELGLGEHFPSFHCLGHYIHFVMEMNRKGHADVFFEESNSHAIDEGIFVGKGRSNSSVFLKGICFVTFQWTCTQIIIKRGRSITVQKGSRNLVWDSFWLDIFPVLKVHLQENHLTQQ